MGKSLLYLVMMGAIISLSIGGCAGSNPQQRATSSASSREGLLVSMDVDLVRDERELVQRAALVAHAVPVGNIKAVPLGREGVTTNYYQDIRVIEVLKGQAPGDTAIIVTTGINSDARAVREAKPGVKLVIEDEEELNGPLAAGKQILFLQPSAKPGVFQVVGLRQGVLPLNDQGQVASAHTFKSFIGLDVAGVRQKINELSLGLRGQTSQQQRAQDNSSVVIVGPSQGNQQTAQQSQPSNHNAAAALMVTYDDLKRVAAVSNLIIKGEVLPGSEVLVDIGARKPYPHAINPVKVISVFKGTPSADVISVGVMLISTEGGDWRLQPGGQVYLFMERVDHGKASYAVPYDYATQGPQGQYYVRNGLIEPKGPPDQATTKQFKGVKEEVFVEELRRAIGSQ